MPTDLPFSIAKQIYELLSQHYVEDDDNLFRFNYSRDFLDWALTAPGAHSDWIIGVRVASTKKVPLSAVSGFFFRKRDLPWETCLYV